MNSNNFSLIYKIMKCLTKIFIFCCFMVRVSKYQNLYVLLQKFIIFLSTKEYNKKLKLFQK